MPTKQLMRLMVLLAKPEATYGVDPTLTGNANAILAKNVSIRPMEGEDVPRNLIRSYLSGEATIPAGLRGVLEFDTELVGSGTAGVVPGWGVLARGAGCAEVIEADESVTYSPISEGMESLYLKFWLHSTLHAFAGARGSGIVNVDAQNIPFVRWTFTGLWLDPAEVARPAISVAAFKKPAVAAKANTPTFTVNGTTLVMRSTRFDLGCRVEPRLMANEEQIIISDRAETADIVVEATPLSAFNPYNLAKLQTQVPLAIAHGTEAGKIVTINAPNCQLRRPTGVQDNQGIAEWPLSLAPLPTDAGNDQFSIVLT